jgi:predicted glycosyltransferase
MSGSTISNLRDVSPMVHRRFIAWPDGCRVIEVSAVPPHRQESIPEASSERLSGLRFLLYSHDGVGLGHVRRNLTIAAALTAVRPESSVLVATGAEEVDAFTVPSSVDLLRVPGLRKLDNRHYAARRLAVSPSDVHNLRSGILAAAVERYRPHVVLADKHPGGVQGELVPALQRQRAAGGRAAFGLRDVLDDPDRAREEWVAGGARDHLAEFHDLVLVYGQSGLLDPLASCPMTAELRARVRYCGYVVSGTGLDAAPVMLPPGRGRHRPLVLACAGGGEDAGPLLRAFLQAAHGASWEALAVTGPMAAAAEHDLLASLAASARARFVRSVRDLGSQIAAADAVVCMGGYNTLAETLATSTPAVCVPRVVPRTEQLVRARTLADLGLLRVVEPDFLTAVRLRDEIDAAVATDRCALGKAIRATIDFGGACRAAEELIGLAGAATVRPSNAGMVPV